MTSNRPYLIRALFEWITDNDCTPYLIVSTRPAGVSVPTAYVENQRIVLNISPQAVRELSLGNDRIEFNGRFAGQPFPVSVPVSAVLAIYAKETGEGSVFQVDDTPTDPSPDEPGSGSHLRVVK
jgi:stringent starvation protein B